MAKAVLAGMLVLGLAACTGGAAKVARDGAPPEQLLAGVVIPTASTDQAPGVEALAAMWSSRPAPRSYLRSRIH